MVFDFDTDWISTFKKQNTFQMSVKVNQIRILVCSGTFIRRVAIALKFPSNFSKKKQEIFEFRKLGVDSMFLLFQLKLISHKIIVGVNTFMHSVFEN